MKRLKTLSIVMQLVLAVTILSSCQKEPTASFTTNKQTYVAGDKITTTNKSTDADHYKWTLSDGQTSTSKDIDYTTDINQSDGTFSLKLEAFSKNGKKTDDVSQTVNITAARGNCIFWQSSGTDITTVTLNSIDQDINANYASAPDCGTTDCACYNNLRIGNYSYYATDGTYEWSGTITIYKNLCSSMELAYKSAKKCVNPKLHNSKK